MRVRTASRWRAWAALGVAALATGLVSACGGASSAGPADGFQRVRTGWVQLDVPEDWREVALDAGQDDLWKVSYEDPQGTTQLLLAPEYSDHSTAGEANADLVGLVQLGQYPSFEIVPREENKDQDDFRTFARTDATYGEGTTYEAVIWGVADEDEHAVLAQLTSESLDPQLVQQIEDSFVVDAG
ncbi:hypothetical protein [Puerhibacterium puerhi]|uniref:hypothetical protein n=1 Tax=Puerhibacterium puerhi TaxID=2692623 RepID=UPI0013567602|nr:hypothetical protein [Puerhibacterium puerhi]